MLSRLRRNANTFRHWRSCINQQGCPAHIGQCGGLGHVATSHTPSAREIPFSLYVYRMIRNERFFNALTGTKFRTMCVNRIYSVRQCWDISENTRFTRRLCFLGMHARVNVWYCLDHFLHFMVFTCYEDTIGNTNSVVIRVHCIPLNRVWATRHLEIELEGGTYSGQAARVHGRRLWPACITCSWSNGAA